MVGQKDELLFEALAMTAERRTGEFNPQDLANIAWALTESAGGVLRVVEAKLKGTFPKSSKIGKKSIKNLSLSLNRKKTCLGMQTCHTSAARPTRSLLHGDQPPSNTPWGGFWDGLFVFFGVSFSKHHVVLFFDIL